MEGLHRQNSIQGQALNVRATSNTRLLEMLKLMEEEGMRIDDNALLYVSLGRYLRMCETHRSAVIRHQAARILELCIDGRTGVPPLEEPQGSQLLLCIMGVALCLLVYVFFLVAEKII